LTEAERVAPELEPFLVEGPWIPARKLSGLDSETRGGSPHHDDWLSDRFSLRKLAAVRMEHNRLAETLKSLALNRIPRKPDAVLAKLPARQTFPAD